MVISFVPPGGGTAVATTDAQGDPLPIPSNTNLDLAVNTGKIIQGATHG
jgi:hypothetical protein